MPAVVSDIISAVINELSQVPGLATQVYSTPRITQFIQNAFLMEIEEMWWKDYMAMFGPIPLDGSTGLLTQDLTGPISSIDNYGDIRIAWPDTSNIRLAQLPTTMNPSTLSGTGRLFMDADYTIPHRPMRVFPQGAAGNVMIHARQRNKMPITSRDTVYLDALLLQYDAAWMYCVDDGSVPAQANKFQGMAVKRRQQMKSAQAIQPLTLDPRFPAGTDQWWTVP